MTKRIISKENLLPKMKAGMADIAAVVKRTLGPGGQPIFIQRIGQMPNGDPLGPKITKDGVSVADECFDPDPEKDLIIQAVKAICRKTNTVAGDGTTTAIVLGEALLNEMLGELEGNKQLNPQLVRESVESASREILAELKKRAKKVKNTKLIAQVATISANGEEEIGEVIGQAFEKVGAEGVVVVDEGTGINTTLDVVEGYQVQRGAEFRDIFFNNQDRTQFEAVKAKLIIFDGKIVNYTSLVPVLTQLAQASKQNNRPAMPPVVIMANEFSQEVIQWLLIQKNDGGMQFCAVKGPHATTVRSGYYDDIAVMSGGSRLGNGGANLENATLDDVGEVERVVIDKYTTTFYDGQGDEEEMLARVEQLRAMKAKAESPYDEQILTDRIGALTQGIAKIGVGGSTDLEIKEKYDRIEDALNSARAAIEEGVIPGGGVTLLKIAVDMEVKSIGHKILQKALKSPFYQILANIEHELSQAEFEAVMKDKNAVYDARNKTVVDAMSAGIIDPVKVTRTGLENAVSIAALLSTAGGGIVFVKEDGK
jgi:chaperonin GroEL